MRTCMIWTALIVSMLMIGSAGAAEAAKEMVDNPMYKSWSGCKVGAYVEHKTETTAAGQKTTLDESTIDWPADQVNGQLTHAGYRLHLPKSASIHWPALPHNPYRKDGHATPAEGRIEIRIPFDTNNTKHIIMMEILE